MGHGVLGLPLVGHDHQIVQHGVVGTGPTIVPFTFVAHGIVELGRGTEQRRRPLHDLVVDQLRIVARDDAGQGGHECARDQLLGR